MSTKEMVYNTIEKLSDKQVEALLNFINSMFEDSINEDTLSVLEDVENGRNLSGTFNTASELWEDLNAEN